MGIRRLCAADKGVQPFQAVHQALSNEKIEGAIDRRRRGAVAFAPQGIEKRVGAHRFVAVPHQLENAAAQAGQPAAVAFTVGDGGFEGGPDAVGMVVSDGRKGEGIGYHAVTP